MKIDMPLNKETETSFQLFASFLTEQLHFKTTSSTSNNLLIGNISFVFPSSNNKKGTIMSPKG